MRLRIVFHYVGIVITAIGLFMIIPFICSLIYHESDWPSFIISAGITTASGFLIWYFTPREEQRLLLRETLAIVAFSWILIAAFGALPYVFAGTFTNFIDAYFESMSGFTATGATVMNSIESQSHGILLWRGLTQWMTGLGIITLFVSLFPALGVGAIHLVKAEMSTLVSEKITPRIRDMAKLVWIIYIGFSVLEIIFLCIAGLPLFDSLTVTFGTMATGGFSAKQLSIEAYQSWQVDLIVIGFMILAAINFRLFFSLIWKRDFRTMFKDSELRLFLGILAVAVLFVTLDLIINSGLNFGEALRNGSFNTISIMTTTGFSNADFNLWPTLSKAILVILMIIGGSSGSTAGAIKVTRVMVLLKNSYRQILHAINPRAVLKVKVAGKAIEEDRVSEALGMSVIYIFVLVVAVLIMSAVGLDLVSAVSSVAACMGTVGPGLNLVGPMENYLWIHPVGKLTLIFCMVLGRLELFTVLALFVPSYWKWR